MRDIDDDDIRGSLERITSPTGETPTADALWGDLVDRRHRRRNRTRALAVLPLLLVAVLAVGVLSVRGSDNDARSDVAAGRDGAASSESWDRLPDAPISARTGAVAIATDDELVIWGGRDDSGVLNDGAAYSFDDRTWTTMRGPLLAREGAVAVWTGEEVLVWGGTITADDGSTVGLYDGASWDPDTNTWTEFPEEVEYVGAVEGVTGAAWTGDELVLVGVTAAPNAFLPSETAAFDPAALEWRALEPTPDTSSDDLRNRKAFVSGQEVVVATVTNDVEVSVSTLDPASGEWTDFPLTWEAESPVDVDDIAWGGAVLTFVGHDTPGTVFSTTGNGSMSNIPATRSELRLDPVALDDGIVTVGDKWFDTDDGSVDIYAGTWNDPKSVPAALDGSAVTVAHDGKLYAWNGAGFVWTPGQRERPGAGTGGDLRVENIQVVGNGPLGGGTAQAVIDFNRPLPSGDAHYVPDIGSADPASGLSYTTQGPNRAIVCDSVHGVPEGAVGSVDLLVPAGWFADGEAHTVEELETVDDPAKFPICGPHNGFIQYAMWSPLSADPADVTVTVSPDRTSVTIDIAPGEATLDPVAGQRVVAKFLDHLRAGDLVAAAELWTGYPELGADSTPADRAPYVEDLMADPTFARILRSDATTTFVTPSTDEAGRVVTILEARDEGSPPAAIAFLTGWSGEQGSSGTMWIHRLPFDQPTTDTVDLPAGSYVEAGQDIAVPGVPLEGGARAFLGDQEIPVEVDYDNLAMIITIPEGVGGDAAVTVVTSSPELPGVRAFAVTVR